MTNYIFEIRTCKQNKLLRDVVFDDTFTLARARDYAAEQLQDVARIHGIAFENLILIHKTQTKNEKN